MKGSIEPCLWFLSGRFASDSASQKLRRDTVRFPCAPWTHESQRFGVTLSHESQRETAVV